MWKSLADAVLGWFGHDGQTSIHQSEFIGLLFILQSVALIYILIHKHISNVIQSKNRHAGLRLVSFEASEPSLQESEDLNRAVVEDLTETICLIDQDGTLTFVNDVFCRYFGKTRDEFLGSKWHRVAFPDDVPLVEERLRALSPTNPVIVVENRVCPGSGAIRWMQFVNRGFFDAEGRLMEVQAVGRDITESKSVEEALKEKTSQLQAILDYSPALISIKDLTGNVILANRNFEVLDAPPMHEFIGKNVFDLFPKEVAQHLWNNDLAALRANGPVESEEVVKHKDGSWHTYITLKFPVHKVPGQPFGICAISTDITERKRSEETICRYAQRLIEMEEDLRKKLAIELHDEIGQNLAVLNINNVVISNSLPMEARKSYNASVEVAEGLIMEISNNVRNIMANLWPPVLDEYGLPAALQWQAEQLTKRIGIEISVQVEDPFPRLATDKEIALFRIAQEALTNTAKYAEARNVIVGLESHGGWVRLNVIDDGKGFVPESASTFQPGSGWGLTIMRERAELIGGRFTLCSKPGKGTTVTVDVPKDSPRILSTKGSYDAHQGTNSGRP